IMTVEERQATVANNIANASTVGFKAFRPVQEGFYSVFESELRRPFHFRTMVGPGGGTRMAGTYSDLKTGVLQKTGDPLNVALQGPGFIAVNTPHGDRFTRAGVFSVNAGGQLVTPDGYVVQSASGDAIDVRGERVNITHEGVVQVDGVSRGRMRVVEFENPHLLMREGYTLYQAPPEAMRRSTAATETEVHQGHLEMANVNLPREMIEMTMGLRTYAANQRVMNAMDETMGQLIERVGSPV
ncbi:MAG TPA: flagellar hook-basal body protein, partial [Candidatus Hydrogenedentes bacterium]|nr:flagellar hook-basal body protein [Candidatus Hydrogenedentota bacterium]